MSSLSNFNVAFQSKDPDVIAAPAQISYPPEPSFGYLEVPTRSLQANRINASVSDQLRILRILTDSVEESKPFLPFLYTYRSVNFVFNLEAEIKEYNKDPSTLNIDVDTYNKMVQEFFLPKFEVFSQIHDFATHIVGTLTPIIETSVLEVSDVVFTRFTELLSIIFNIEQLKLLKTGISKDLSFFKRNTNLDKELSDRIGKVQMFLANKNGIFENIRIQIENDNMKYKKGEKPVSLRFIKDYLEYCVRAFKSQTMQPSLRMNLIIGMMCALYIHGSKNPIANVFTLPICKDVLEILSNNAVVPLYGEARYIPGEMLTTCPGFIPNKSFPLATTTEEIKKSQDSYLLKNKMAAFRASYREFVPIAAHLADEDAVKFDDLKRLVVFLTQMINAISSQSAYKFTIPAKYQKTEDGATVYCYDLAVSQNYTDEDLDALGETIGYVKTLASTIMKNEETIVAKIGKTIHHIVQEFLDNVIHEPMQRANNANDDDSTSLLQAIYDVFSTESEGIAPLSKEHLDVLRIQLESLISSGSKFVERVAMFTGSHFKSSHVKMIEKFLADSADWYCLYNFVPTLRAETNLGFLWFHETMLDIDKVAQFPVRSSLPFILMKHLLSSGNSPALQDLVFFPFEIYNDAAWQALNIYKSQYLFQEISAEMKLSVDMIAFTFADTFYKIARETAAATEIAPELTGEIIPTPMRYSIMVRQNKMEVLGAPIDFNMITTTKLNARLKEELDKYVKMMNDLRFIPYVAHLYRVAQTTYSILAQSKLLLDPFDVLWDAARGAETPLSVSPKMISNIDSMLDFSHMKLDYHELRFTYVKPQQITPLSNEEWAVYYSKIHKNDSSYVERKHISDLCFLLNGNEMSILLQSTLKRFTEACTNALDCYNEFRTTIRLLPALSRHDLAGYYDFNMDAYSSVAHTFLGKFYAQMRIIGNIIIFVNELDEEKQMASTNKGLFIAKFLKTVQMMINDRKDLFYCDDYLDIETVITHSNFCAIWSVLEFIFCSPKTFYLSESNPAILLMDTFGDGPLVAAHTFISICNQQSRYAYNSICTHALELLDMEENPIEKADLSKFLDNANKANDIRYFTQSICAAFALPPE